MEVSKALASFFDFYGERSAALQQNTLGISCPRDLSLADRSRRRGILAVWIVIATIQPLFCIVD